MSPHAVRCELCAVQPSTPPFLCYLIMQGEQLPWVDRPPRMLAPDVWSRLRPLFQELLQPSLARFTLHGIASESV
jgi:hypothetical protein